MIAQFSIVPTGTDHMGKDVERALQKLDEIGMPRQVGAIGTCIEGDLDQILRAIAECHRVVADSHARVVTTVIIDDNRASQQSMEEVVAKVDDRRDEDLSTGPQAEDWARDDLREQARAVGVTPRKRGANPLDQVFDA